MQTKRGLWSSAALIGSVVAGAALIAPAVADGPELTMEASSAVSDLFPQADVIGVDREREHDTTYYEVVVRDGNLRREIEVAADGAIGEIETELPLAQAPKAVQAEILRLTGDAGPSTVELHEVRGVAQNGSFAAVDAPVRFYEFAYEIDGTWYEVALGEDGRRLSGEDCEADADDDSDEDDDTAAKA